MIEYKRVLLRQSEMARAILVIVGIYLVTINLLEPNTFTGFILGILVASIIYFVMEAFFKGFWSQLREKWERLRAFEMRFTDLSFNLSVAEQVGRIFYKRERLGIGINIIYLRIIPHLGMDFNRINLRFVNRERWKPWRWNDVPKSIIGIHNMEPYDPTVGLKRKPSEPKPAPGLYRSESGFRPAKRPTLTPALLEVNRLYEDWFAKEPNGIGGYFVEFNPPYQRSKGEPLWLAAKVIANEKWKGHISLKAYRGLNPAAYVRSPIEVIDQPTSDTEDS